MVLADVHSANLADDTEHIRQDVNQRTTSDPRCGDGDGAAESYAAFVRALYSRLKSYSPPDVTNPATGRRKFRKRLGKRPH